MSRQQEEKKPISPQALFEKLLAGNYKEIECVDQASQYRQQKNILLSLLEQYRIEIHKRMGQFEKLESLVLMRNKLRDELEGLRRQRITIDKNIQYEIQKNKVCVEEVADHGRARLQIDDLMQKNMGLELRLRQLSQYCMRLQEKNVNLQKQNMKMEQLNIRTRATSDLGDCGGYGGCGGCGGWRERIQARRMEQQRSNLITKQRIRQKEQENLNYVRRKQAEIAQGNRRRMASFKQRMRRQY